MASSASLQCHSNKVSILLSLPPGETLRAASSKLGQIFTFLSLYSDSDLIIIIIIIATPQTHILHRKYIFHFFKPEAEAAKREPDV